MLLVSPTHFSLHLPALQSDETCYIQVTGMVTADVLESDQEYDDVSRAGVEGLTFVQIRDAVSLKDCNFKVYFVDCCV